MNEQEFNIMVIPLSNKLISLCYRILGDKSEAKDAVQDVYVKLWNDRCNLNGVRSIEAYCYTVTRNHCLDRLKQKKSTFSIDNFTFYEYNDSHEREAEHNERMDAVRAAIAQLPDIQQQVITMRDMEGMEFEEISEIMGISCENSRVTLSRARQKVREIVYSKTVEQCKKI